MKHLCVIIFVLLTFSTVKAEDVKNDTAGISADTLNSVQQAPAALETPVIQEDYSFVPSIVSDSFLLYREQGAEAFVKSILKGSPLEGDESSAKELERMRTVERYYGKMLRHSFISVLKITPFYKKVYIILQFAKGPVFCSIDCYYTSQNTWIVPAFTFNTDITKVFPDILLKQYLENSR